MSLQLVSLSRRRATESGTGDLEVLEERQAARSADQIANVPMNDLSLSSPNHLWAAWMVIRLALTRYRCPVSSTRVPGGAVHKLPGDLRKALIANPTALDAWKDITPLARNEFICWVDDAKQERTRERRIRRTQEELEEGQRRPCCWPGCKHRERTGR